MKTIYHNKVKLLSGYLYEKQILNETTTINAVYDRFYDTGRITAFDFNYKEGDEIKPHVFWDSDVAKWMEGAAYILAEKSDPALEEKVDSLVEKIKEHQGEDGYFNIYFTVVDPNGRFTDRDKHELYCAGHLIDLDPKIQIVRKLAREYADAYLPIDGLLAAAYLGTEPTVYAADGVHPTEEGARFIADYYLEAVCDLIDDIAE